MRIAGLESLSLLDFPDCICCVVFTQGCNLDCFYCHNRALIEPSVPASLSEEKVLSFLKKRAGLLEGVVLTGGEPTLQPDLKRFIISCRALGYKVKLDTNGTRPEVVKTLVNEGLLDYVAIDVKAPLERYGEMTGASQRQVSAVREAIEFLPGSCTSGSCMSSSCMSGSRIRWEARTTLAPGLTRVDLERIRALLPPGCKWTLNDYRMPRLHRPQDEERLHGECLKAALFDQNID